MVLVCAAGRGTVIVNRGVHSLDEESLFVLPWGHSISYVAAETDPFLVGGAHLVPAHAPDRPVRPTVPHDGRHELAGCAWRRDDPELADTAVRRLPVKDVPTLAGIVHHAIETFADGPPPLPVMQALGVLVRHELLRLRAPRPTGHGRVLPKDLRRVASYVERHLDRPLTVRTLADVAGYSEATLNRRFRAELGLPPMAFVTACRMRLARRLLRSTGLTIAQIARRCGIGDPYYFSRLFRDHHGDPPTVWRRVRQL